MVKKERKISIPNFDKSQFLQPTGDLPTSVEITQTVATVTGKPEITLSSPIPTPVVDNTPRLKGRPFKEASKERLPFNTMINLNLSNTLKILAIKRRVSTADLIEIAVTRYFNEEGETC
jgi:hypothetical protein